MVNFLPMGPWDDLRRKVEGALNLPSGSTRPGMFTSGGYRGSPSDETEMTRRLQPYVEDERKAFEDYSHEADLADMIGRPDVAYALRSMSEDEHRHYLNIKAMLADLK